MVFKKNIFLVFLLCSILLVIFGCIEQAPHQSFSLKYTYSTEGNYYGVAIDNYDINYTFAYYDPNRCQNSVLQVPCWDSNDLITQSARLSESDLNSLIWAITKSDFLDLQISDDYDGRYYPVIIEVHLEIGQDSWNKIEVYKSYPGAPERPDSFLLVENLITQLINSKFRDKYGIPPITTK